MFVELFGVDQGAIYLWLRSWWRPACLCHCFWIEPLIGWANEGVLGWMVIQEGRVHTHDERVTMDLANDCVSSYADIMYCELQCTRSFPATDRE